MRFAGHLAEKNSVKIIFLTFTDVASCARLLSLMFVLCLTESHQVVTSSNQNQIRRGTHWIWMRRARSRRRSWDNRAKCCFECVKLMQQQLLTRSFLFCRSKQGFSLLGILTIHKDDLFWEGNLLKMYQRGGFDHTFEKAPCWKILLTHCNLFSLNFS